MSTSASKKLGAKQIRYGVPLAALALVGGGIGVAVAASDGQTATQRQGPSTELGVQAKDTGLPLTYSTARPSSMAENSTGSGAESGGLSMKEAISHVVAGMDGQVVDVSATQSANGPVLEVHLKQSSDDIPDVWHAGLAVGAIGDMIHTDQVAMSQVIAAASATGPGPDGPATWSGVGLSAITVGQLFNSPTDEDLTARVHEVANAFGLQTTRIDILHPLESALAVTFAVPDNKSDWTLDGLRAQLVGPNPDIEGILIQVVTASGKPLANSGISYRTGEHGFWCAPEAEQHCGGGSTFSTPIPDGAQN